MSTMINSTVSELHFLLNQTALTSKTRIRIIFEDKNKGTEMFKRKRTIEAMKQLRGSGNGNLLNVLLTDRRRDNEK